MARTDENVGELGLFVINEPLRPGAQPIQYAFEKLARSQRDDYAAKQMIPGRYVNVSQADYPVSWEAFTWLLEQIQAMQKMLTEKHQAEGKAYRDDNMAYNWAEHLFELAFLPEELIPDYLERSVERSGPMDKDVFDAYLKIAREAKQRFGMEFVNVGTDSVYHNTNRPDQYRDFLISMLSSQAMWDMFDLVERDGKIVDRQGEQVSPAVFSSPIEKGVLISKSIVDLGVQMKKGSVAFNSALVGGTKIDTQGAVVNSVGRFVVPRGAIVDTVIAPAEGLEVMPDSYTRGYLVKKADGSVAQVLVSLPVKILVTSGQAADLKVTDIKSSVDGKRLSRFKVFPRVGHLTNRIPSMAEEAPLKYSLDEIRNNIDKDASWAFRKQLLQSAQDQSTSAFKFAEKMRDSLEKKAGVPAMRSELRKEVPVVPEARDNEIAKAIAAAQSVQTMRNEVRIQTEVVNPEAMRAEARMTEKIMAMMKDLDLQSYGDQTRFVVPYDQDLIQSLIKNHPKAKVVIMAKTADEKAVAEARTAGFTESTGVAFEYVISQDVQAIAKQQAQDLRLEVISNRPNRSVLQVRKVADPKITAAEINRAYALVGQMFGIVAIVGFEKSVDFATDHTFAEILSSEIRAAESIAQSA
jgi:hypothetical protein